MALAVTLVTLAISLLLAPISFAVIGLLLDLINLFLPMPNLIGAAGRTLDAITNENASIPLAYLLQIALLAALPGFALLLLLWWRLGRTVARGNHEALHGLLGLRDPHADNLEEQQLGNVIAEMAIAAALPPPRLKLLPGDACNLGLLDDGKRSVLVVTDGLLQRLDRAQTQALMAQATAALGNGDGRLAVRMLQLGLMIGLLGLLARAPVDVGARAALRPVWRPRASALEMLRAVLGGGEEDTTASDSGGDWRTWLMVPVFGSLLIGILLVPIATALLVAPLNGLIWRRRRLLADATAVQFARDPQALAQAYAALARSQTALNMRLHGLGDVFLLDPGTHSNLRLGSPYPTLAARVARLNAMGASVVLEARATRPWWFWPVALPVGVLVLGLCATVVVLGCWLSLALNGLFLAIPASLLHVALRALAA